ncbi:MAG: type II toxin-antitoxin system RelE/ParE family toxin [bacterium]|nr:type II toxin-antitoxin system RelE/ParE family toxin [bacterium]
MENYRLREEAKANLERIWFYGLEHWWLGSPEAETDLEDIWLYSFEKWSENQADRYYDVLIDGINKLIDNPMLGKSREYVRRDYRSLQINRHVIYYRLQDIAYTAVF